jgi:hypothetical protein
MSDYREVHHGFDLLNRYFAQDTHKTAFMSALNDCSRGIADEAFDLFSKWWHDTHLQTYITCISEHNDSEDNHGRLSMWRAFGGSATARVALVLRIPLKIGFAEPLNAVLSPVGYLADSEVKQELDSITTNIRNHCDFLRSIDRQVLLGSIFNMLITAVCCLKHEGFHEEKEWRIMYSLKRMGSSLMESSIETVGGIPQAVYKIPLLITQVPDLLELPFQIYSIGSSSGLHNFRGSCMTHLLQNSKRRVSKTRQIESWFLKFLLGPMRLNTLTGRVIH